MPVADRSLSLDCLSDQVVAQCLDVLLISTGGDGRSMPLVS
jgi:hypothetical protein